MLDIERPLRGPSSMCSLRATGRVTRRGTASSQACRRSCAWSGSRRAGSPSSERPADQQAVVPCPDPGLRLLAAAATVASVKVAVRSIRGSTEASRVPGASTSRRASSRRTPGSTRRATGRLSRGDRRGDEQRDRHRRDRFPRPAARREGRAQRRDDPAAAEASAIRWAVEMGARVINLSLAGLRDPLDPRRDTYSRLEASAIGTRSASRSRRRRRRELRPRRRVRPGTSPATRLRCRTSSA